MKIDRRSVWGAWQKCGREHARLAARRLLVEAGITRPPVNPYLFLRSYRSPGVEGVDLQWFSDLDLDGWSGYSEKHSTQSYVKKGGQPHMSWVTRS